MTQIAVVAGSTRPHRRARLVADWVVREAQHLRDHGRLDAEVRVVDLAEIDLPLLDEPVPAVFGDYRREHTRRWSRTVAGYDGFIFCVAEYNKSIPAALKNALDFLYAEWANKAAGFVGYGVSGGQRAIEHLRLVCSELRLAHVGSQVELAVGDHFDRELAACIPGGAQRDQLQAVLTDVVAWSDALSTLRRQRAEVLA